MDENIITMSEDGVETMLIKYAKACNGYECMDKNYTPLAMAYVPVQKFENVYSPSQGLENGTLFEKLNFPFLGRRGVSEAQK